MRAGMYVVASFFLYWLADASDRAVTLSDIAGLGGFILFVHGMAEIVTDRRGDR